MGFFLMRRPFIVGGRRLSIKGRGHLSRGRRPFVERRPFVKRGGHLSRGGHTLRGDCWLREGGGHWLREEGGCWSKGRGCWSKGGGCWLRGGGCWSKGGGRWSKGGGHWSRGGGHWSKGGGHWSRGGDHWSKGGGHWSKEGGHWLREGGGCWLKEGGCLSREHCLLRAVCWEEAIHQERGSFIETVGHSSRWWEGKEEQWISMLGNSKFNMITWCRSLNRLEQIAACDLMLFTCLSLFFHIKYGIRALMAQWNLSHVLVINVLTILVHLCFSRPFSH